VRDVRERLQGFEYPPVELSRSGERAAAVLLPVFEEDGEARVILTKRPETMASHQGDIAFPGGKIDPSVDHDARDAALRETEEEIGIPRDTVDVIAALPAMSTVVGTFLISPFVGIVEGRPVITRHPREVDLVFDVSLAELLTEGVYREERWGRDEHGIERLVAFFELEGETVWGATARILMGFLALVVDVPVNPGWFFG
jgi:8-oxo-dGTP pyrophosphatase MutT (NUDIX family)